MSSRRERHERDDVRRADPRMRALVPAQVDPLARAARSRRAAPRRARSSVADEREDRAVVVRVGVHVEQPRARRRARRASASIVAAVAALGEVRHGLERQRHVRTLGAVKAYYDRRRRSTTTGGAAAGLFAERDRPGWDDERRARFDARSRRSRRRGRSTSPAAPASSPATSPARSSGLDQSDAMLEVARRAGARTRRSSRATRSRSRSTTARSSASSRATSTGTSRSDERVRFLAEARRVAPELVVVDAALRARRRARASWQERVLNDGSRWHGLQAVLRAATSSLAELGGGEILFDGRWFVVVARVTRRRSSLPLARLAPARQPRAAAPASRPATRSSRCRSSQPYAGQRAYLFGQAPGVGRGRASGARGAAAPGRRCAAGSSSTRTRSTRPSTARRSRAATRAARRRGRGDRTPTPREQELCAFWREWELALLRPALIVTVGGLAARRLLGLTSADRVRRRDASSCDGAVAIPLPHPSGASGWLERPGEPRPRSASALSTLVRGRARAARRRTAWTLDFGAVQRARLATARTFVRLLGFLRPYRWSLVVSIVLAVGSQAAAIALDLGRRAT